MDAAVIKYYRRLLRTGFEHAGSLENPSIFLDTINENITVCGNAGNYLHLYLNVHHEVYHAPYCPVHFLWRGIDQGGFYATYNWFCRLFKFR
jgi:hypothetical protein